MVTTKQILNGFLRNYGSLQIATDGTHTSWTFKSMDYFNRLGKLLGYWVEFEGHKYDQTWFKFLANGKSKEYDPNKLFLHLEHENEPHRVSKTIDKLVVDSNKPRAKKMIGIVYPDKKLFLKDVNDFKDRSIVLTANNEEVMIIFLGLYQESDDNGYWPVTAIRKFSSNDEVRTIEYGYHITENKNEILYAVFE